MIKIAYSPLSYISAISLQFEVNGMMQSEGDVFVALVFAVFVGPGIALQEILNCLPYGHVGVKRALDRLSCEWVCPAILLQVLLNCLFLIGLAAVCGDWVFHEFQCDSAGEIVGNAEDQLFISGFNECLQFGLLGFKGEGVVLVDIFLHFNQSYLVFLCGFYPGIANVFEPEIEEQFFSQINVSANLFLQFDAFSAIQSQSLGQSGNAIFHFPHRVFLLSQFCQCLATQQMSTDIGGIEFDCFLCIFECCFCSSKSLQALCAVRVEYALSGVDFDGATIPNHCLLVISLLICLITLYFPIKSSALLHFFFLFWLGTLFSWWFAAPT